MEREGTPNQNDQRLDLSELRIDLRFTLFAPTTQGSSAARDFEESKKASTIKHRASKTRKDSTATASLASNSCLSPMTVSHKFERSVQPHKIAAKSRKSLEDDNKKKTRQECALKSGQHCKSQQSIFNQSSFITSKQTQKNLNSRKFLLPADLMSQSSSSNATLQLSHVKNSHSQSKTARLHPSTSRPRINSKLISKALQQTHKRSPMSSTTALNKAESAGLNSFHMQVYQALNQ